MLRGGLSAGMGQEFKRDYREPFAQAIERMLQPRANFVTLAAGTTPVPTLRYPSDESDFWRMHGHILQHGANRREGQLAKMLWIRPVIPKTSREGGNRPAAPLPVAA